MFAKFQENTCARVSFVIKLQTCNIIKKESGTGVSQFFKSTFFIKHLWWLLLARLFFAVVDRTMINRICNNMISKTSLTYREIHFSAMIELSIKESKKKNGLENFI